jgi:F-type H+-transporting ATPase subunit b
MMAIDEAGWVAFGFIVFCAIAWRYGAKPFVNVLQARADEVQKKLEEAEALRQEAKEVLNNYKILQQEAEEEAKNIILRAQENAKNLQKSAEENTNKFILRQEDQIKQKIKAAEKQAIIDVKNIVVDLSISASEKCLNKEINERRSNDMILESSKSLNINA